MLADLRGAWGGHSLFIFLSLPTFLTLLVSVVSFLVTTVTCKKVCGVTSK